MVIDLEEGGPARWVKREELRQPGVNTTGSSGVRAHETSLFSCPIPSDFFYSPLKWLWSPQGSQFSPAPLLTLLTYTVNLFHYSDSVHSSWNHCSRWDVSTETLRGPQCVEFENPLQWVRRWFVPIQARHYITAEKSSLHFTVPLELKLHDEWRGNQIDFPMQRDSAALETVPEEELFLSPAKRASR